MQPFAVESVIVPMAFVMTPVALIFKFELTLMVGVDEPVSVPPALTTMDPVCVQRPVQVTTPVTPRLLPTPVEVVGVAPKGQVVEAAIVTAAALLIVNLLKVDRVSVIVAAAVILIVPLLCANVDVLPLWVHEPASVHVPLEAVNVPPLRVTAVVDIAPAEPVKVPLTNAKVVEVKL